MAKMVLQFHACRDEVFSWVTAWAQQMDLFVALESFAPEYQVKPVDFGQSNERMQVSREVSRLSLNLRPIDLKVTSSLDFLRRNPDMLTVSLGGQTDDSLRESALAAMTNDQPSLAAWKAIRNKAKASMHSDGVSVINPVLKVRQSVKSHYYSQGAHELARLGIRMLAAAGWNEYKIDH